MPAVVIAAVSAVREVFGRHDEQPRLRVNVEIPPRSNGLVVGALHWFRQWGTHGFQTTQGLANLTPVIGC